MQYKYPALVGAHDDAMIKLFKLLQNNKKFETPFYFCLYYYIIINLLFNLLNKMNTKLFPCIKNGDLFASYDADSQDMSSHVKGPYWSNEFNCEAFLIFDSYGKKPIFSTSDGTRLGFGCNDVIVKS